MKCYPQCKHESALISRSNRMTCSLPTHRVSEETPLQLVVRLITHWGLVFAQLAWAPLAQLDLGPLDIKESGLSKAAQFIQISLPVGSSFIINVCEGVSPIHQSHWDALSGQHLWGCSGEQEIYLKQSFKGHLSTVLEMKSELPCREDFSECVASWLLVNGPSVHQVTKLSLWTLTSHSL